MTFDHPKTSSEGVRSISKTSLFWSAAMALSLGLVSLLFLDQAVTQAVTTKKHVSWYQFIRFLTDFGVGTYYFSGVILAGLASWILIRAFPRLKDSHQRILKRLAAWSFYAFNCMLFSGIVLQIFKHVLGRQRPHVSADTNPHVFDFLTGHWHYHSMPSGHSQTLFTFTTILWITFPRLGKWVFLVPAVLALTRVPLEEHFLSDVIIGSYLGFVMTVLVSSRFRKIVLT